MLCYSGHLILPMIMKRLEMRAKKQLVKSLLSLATDEHTISSRIIFNIYTHLIIMHVLHALTHHAVLNRNSVLAC